MVLLDDCGHLQVSYMGTDPPAAATAAAAAAGGGGTSSGLFPHTPATTTTAADGGDDDEAKEAVLDYDALRKEHRELMHVIRKSTTRF